MHLKHVDYRGKDPVMPSMSWPDGTDSTADTNAQWPFRAGIAGFAGRSSPIEDGSQRSRGVGMVSG
jgi:hypothetical protein